MRTAAACAAAAVLTACANQGYSVIASTATTIGVSIGQQPANGTMDATLGYKRAEFALVPTNRAASASEPKGASDSSNVIMELRYGGIFSTGGDSGIYQRLAIGDQAVKQKGAAYMFAKGNDGKLDPRTAAAVAKVPVALERPDAMKPLASKYVELEGKKDADALKKFDKAAQDAGYTDFEDFYFNGKEQDIPKVRKALEDAGVKFS